MPSIDNGISQDGAIKYGWYDGRKAGIIEKQCVFAAAGSVVLPDLPANSRIIWVQIGCVTTVAQVVAAVELGLGVTGSADEDSLFLTAGMDINATTAAGFIEQREPLSLAGQGASAVSLSLFAVDAAGDQDNSETCTGTVNIRIFFETFGTPSIT